MDGSIRVAAYLERRRLEEAFARAAARRVTVCCSSSGGGKSTAIGAQVRRFDGLRSHYVPGSDVRGLIAFVRGLADQLSESLPALGHGFAAAAANAMRQPRAGTALAVWFVDHLAGRNALLALDGLQSVDDCDDIVEFIVRAIEYSDARVQWILGMRSTTAFPIATWLAAEIADLQIDEALLAFTRAEAVGLAGRLDVSPVRALAALETTGGHAGRFVLALLAAAARDGRVAVGALGNGLNDSEPQLADVETQSADVETQSADFEAQLEEASRAFLASLPTAYVRALHALLQLPALDEALVNNVCDGPGLLARIGAEAPYALRLSAKWHFTRTFAAIVERRSPADEALRAEGTDLALAALVGAPVVALRVAARAGAVTAILRLLERHGFALSEAGYGDLIDEALTIVPQGERSASYAALALEAMRESDLGRHDVADAWFAHAAELAPDPLDRYRVHYVYAGNLLRRGRLDCIDVLESIVDKPATPELQASVIATLGAAYGAAGRWQEARRRIAEALLRIDDIADIATRASVYQSAAYVALQDGDAPAAERYASVALSLADEHGHDRIAVLALIVRYVVASSFKDDIASALSILGALERYANRLGNAFFRRYALLGMMESHAQRGDRDELERTERALACEELENDVVHAEESLLPARAMRLAGTGDFTGAYRLLSSSAERPMEAHQRALRFAEIAVYAAAADLDDVAGDAIASARRALRRAPSGPTATLMSVRLHVALASLLLGRLRSAAGVLCSTERATADLPRLRKFHALLRAMLDHRRGATNHDELLRLLETMDDEGFGGIAQIIEALPGVRLHALELAS